MTQRYEDALREIKDDRFLEKIISCCENSYPELRPVESSKVFNFTKDQIKQARSLGFTIEKAVIYYVLSA
jgi:hypothetical protein